VEDDGVDENTNFTEGSVLDTMVGIIEGRSSGCPDGKDDGELLFINKNKVSSNSRGNICKEKIGSYLQIPHDTGQEKNRSSNCVSFKKTLHILQSVPQYISQPFGQRYVCSAH
jgi:hypothetical protein